MNTPEINLHAQGLSAYTDDIIPPKNTLYGSVFTSPVAHGMIVKLDVSAALKSPGVAAIFTAKDIPGENQLGEAIKDQQLLADKEVLYVGQPIAVVIAESKDLADKARSLINLEVKELRPVIDERESYKKGKLIQPPRIFSIGNVTDKWKKCDVILEGSCKTGTQEHFYLETQSALAVPVNQKCLKIYSATQSPMFVQKIASGILGLDMHDIEVEVGRLGGGFGGKEEQGAPWAAMAALGAYLLNKPVKITLSRAEDIIFTGKRHPYSSDYRIGLTRRGKILAYEVTYYQNSGAAADLSTAILERSLFHITNSYNIPNVKATGICCYTNLVPFTAFRGFGAPQAMFVMESAIHKAAEKLNMDASEIQKINLLKDGDRFPYGMKVKMANARKCFAEAEKKYGLKRIHEECVRFNARNAQFKKGVAVMPLCFGISFTTKFLNQGGALINVYKDGSIQVTTGVTEMGQGVFAKIAQIVSEVFSVDIGRVRIDSTSTATVPNTSPTAASTGTDLNGMAAKYAAEEILGRLKSFCAVYLKCKEKDVSISDEWVYMKKKKTDLKWKDLVLNAYHERTDLSAHGFYATPNLHFDRTINKGSPLAYHVYGTGIIEVTLDCLRGNYDIDSVKIIHDAGKSLNKDIDLGQIYGGIVQGMGWLTLENMQFDENGRIIQDSAASYKIPDIKFAPGTFEVELLKDSINPYAVNGSKATGEPPFIYGIGIYFALLNAIKAFNADFKPDYTAPMTTEKILLSLYGII